VQLLEGQPEPHFASVDAGLRTYKAQQLLGEIYHRQGRFADAETQWRAAVPQRPDFVASWQALGQLFLKQQRWPELDNTLLHLETLRAGSLEAAVLRGRAALARREFMAARRYLEQAIAAWPQALGPRIFLSHVLLQEGQDHGAAEQALRDILALDPRHAEARHNLATLLRNRQLANAAPQSGRNEIKFHSM
jgi:tetratricopeptide (TPR) repeat protein